MLLRLMGRRMRHSVAGWVMSEMLWLVVCLLLGINLWKADIVAVIIAAHP